MQKSYYQSYLFFLQDKAESHSAGMNAVQRVWLPTLCFILLAAAGGVALLNSSFSEGISAVEICCPVTGKEASANQPRPTIIALSDTENLNSTCPLCVICQCHLAPCPINADSESGKGLLKINSSAIAVFITKKPFVHYTFERPQPKTNNLPVQVYPIYLFNQVFLN